MGLANTGDHKGRPYENGYLNPARIIAVCLAHPPHMPNPLDSFVDPVAGAPWGELGAVRRAARLDDRWHVDAVLGYPVDGLADTYSKELSEWLDDEVVLDLTFSPTPHQQDPRRRQPHRRGIRQGRRRQVHHRRQPRPGPRPRRRQSRHSRRRHLRPQPRPDARRRRRTATGK